MYGNVVRTKAPLYVTFVIYSAAPNSGLCMAFTPMHELILT